MGHLSNKKQKKNHETSNNILIKCGTIQICTSFQTSDIPQHDIHIYAIICDVCAHKSVTSESGIVLLCRHPIRWQVTHRHLHVPLLLSSLQWEKRSRRHCWAKIEQNLQTQKLSGDLIGNGRMNMNIGKFGSSFLHAVYQKNWEKHKARKEKKHKLFCAWRKWKAFQTFQKTSFIAFLDEKRVVKYCSSQKSESKSV